MGQVGVDEGLLEGLGPRQAALWAPPGHGRVDEFSFTTIRAAAAATGAGRGKRNPVSGEGDGILRLFARAKSLWGKWGRATPRLARP